MACFLGNGLGIVMGHFGVGVQSAIWLRKACALCFLVVSNSFGMGGGLHAESRKTYETIDGSINPPF